MNHVSQKVSEFVIDRYGSSGVVIDDQGKERFLFQVSDITELVAAIRGVYKLDPSSGFPAANGVTGTFHLEKLNPLNRCW